MDIIALVIQLVAGAVGGNVAGGLLKNLSLGTLGNSIVGILGGGLGGQILSMGLGVSAGGGGLDIASILSNVASGGVGGGVLMLARTSHTAAVVTDQIGRQARKSALRDGVPSGKRFDAECRPI